MTSSDGVLTAQLTDNDTNDFEPTASADGELVAFARESFEIQIDGEATTSEFSAIDGDIFTMTPDGDNQMNVTGAATEFSVSEEVPNFSPDSSRIVFARCVQDDGCGPGSLASVPAGGGAITPITDNTSVEDDPSDDDPAFAPDGTRIVYWRANFVEERVELAFVAPTGGATAGFLEDEPGSRFHPDWQPLAVPPPPPAATGAGAAPSTQSESRRTPRCFGRKVTILGTNKSEKIVGTRGDDVIKGRKGRDKIFGKGGDDVICAGGGNNQLHNCQVVK